jgi:hypothetical protein
MRLLFSMVTASAIALSATACGDKSTGSATGARAGREATSAAKETPPTMDWEGDYDDPARTYYDRDDADVVYFGREVAAAERQAISALVTRYHAAAAHHDGATACRLLHPVLAEVVSEEYVEPRAHRKTCASVLSAYFKRIHGEIQVEDAAVVIGSIRVGEGRGVVMLGYPGVKPRRDMPIKLDKGVWKVNDVLDTTLP